MEALPHDGGGATGLLEDFGASNTLSAEQVQLITIGGKGWTDKLWVSVTFADELQVGVTVEPHRPDGGKLYIRFPKRPVLRVAA
ncbi:hypothetical protein D0962_06605 [Leptolyngbyaceae cyanobacterium CCMR0082]|uniref:Uncharacterized protein n=1 Tax=Adonisia turfae CCMR0082 TaxID=2304604 RepID=A0A6M0S324_9CYAN|nr:hypothetical protein [Adonisia turfae]NEZ62453.1 hypothetical protein [Adonisia turfae CCMR0082]